MKRSKNNRKKRAPWFALLAVVLIGGAAFGWIHRKAASAAIADAAGAGIVKKQDLIQRITVAGIVIPKRRTVIVPPYNGYIKKMYVQVGAKVRTGDPIVSVVQSLLPRSEEAFPIRAPFAGTVVQVLREDGEYVETSGDSNVLVRIDDLSQLSILSDVPEVDVVNIHRGQEVVIKAAPILGRTYKGVIREITLAAREKKEWARNSDKVEFPVRVEIVDQDAEIRPGMSAIIDIIANRRDNALTLRHEYVQKEGEKFFVTLDSGEHRPIETGLKNEELIEITKGLREGDHVKLVNFLAL
ncbi:MAG: efflux RND transporter periplasmic adaptor subunit [Bdellovibrionota bacterium]